MAIFKCKMCGGDLNTNTDVTVAECEYCGTKQTVPKNNSDVISNLFNRANNLRLKCEFDKAMQVYEKIVEQDDSEAEAHWGIVLCKYGIEYVNDPATSKKIPTCHRTLFEAVTADADYVAAIDYSDSAQQLIYEQEARAIDKLQRNILNIVKNEKPFDIFICYKETDENGKRTIDSTIANDIYYQLTQEGFKVFFAAITLEDKLGQEYEPYIFAALNSVKVMLSIGTKPEYFSSVWVKNEWSRFLQLMKSDRSKLLIPCYRDMDAYDLPEEFAHLQAQDMSKIGFINDVVRGIKKVLVKENNRENTSPTVSNNSPVTPLLERAFIFLEDEDWESADEYCEKVLDIDPKCAKAYLGKALAEFEYRFLDDVLENENLEFFDSKNINKVYRFADDDLCKELNDISKKLNDNLNEIEEPGSLIVNHIEIKAKENDNPLDRIVDLAVGDYHTVAVRSDGTVVATGKNNDGQCNVENWGNVVSVSAGSFHTVALLSNGYVMATGENCHKQCQVNDWEKITAIATGCSHTVGLSSDGTVVATGENDYGQCDVSDWKNIVSISAGYAHTVALKSNGTVVATGSNDDGECNVEHWNNIATVVAGDCFTIGIKIDGTIVSAGNNENGQCDIHDMQGIRSIDANGDTTILINNKNECTVLGCGFNLNPEEWRNIILMKVGINHIVGLKYDGTVVATGENEDGQCDVSKWKLFKDYNNLDSERQEGIEKYKNIVELRKLSNSCRYCGGRFKGLFTKKCENCGMEKDY